MNMLATLVRRVAPAVRGVWPRMIGWGAVVVAGILLPAGAVVAQRAGDAWYSVDAGGLISIGPQRVGLEKVSLEISFSNVNARYAFKTLDNKDKTGLVGFRVPHPGFLAGESGAGIAGVRTLLSSLALTVNGKAKRPRGLRYQVEATADDENPLFDPGDLPLIDVTDIFVKEGVKLNDLNANLLGQLSRSPLREKIRAALPSGYDEAFPHSLRGWVIPYWEQTFKGGQTLNVEQNYTPAPGGYLFTAYTIADLAGNFLVPQDEIDVVEKHIAELRDQLREELTDVTASPYAVSCSLEPADLNQYLEDWLRQEFDRHATTKARRKAIRQTMGFMTFDLKTLRTWTGPIANFTLTVKGDGRPVLFCFPGPIELIDAEQFVYRAQLFDFVPRADLALTRLQ